MATKTGTKANPDMSTYYDNLQPTDQKGYRRKIEILDYQDPYQTFSKWRLIQDGCHFIIYLEKK